MGCDRCPNGRRSAQGLPGLAIIVALTLLTVIDCNGCTVISDNDAALRALFWPFDTGELVMPAAPVLFLSARPGFWHSEHAGVDWRCEQPFAPFAQELQRRGIATQAQVADTGFALTLALPGRQRDEARALLARALRATAAGGRVVVAATNTDGARSLEADLRTLTGTVHSASKHKSRVIWADVSPSDIDTEKRDEWLALAEPRELVDGAEHFWSVPGLFAWDRVDPASALLADHLPATLTGRVADLGAAWGYLAMQVIRRCPSATRIDLFEANARALEPARRNLDNALAGRQAPVCSVHWHDVTAGLPERYDVVVSNPPFHIGQTGRADLPQLGRAFIRSAANALGERGQAWIVANRHLPYEAALAERFARVETPVQQGGFKVIHAQGPKR